MRNTISKRAAPGRGAVNSTRCRPAASGRTTIPAAAGDCRAAASAASGGTHSSPSSEFTMACRSTASPDSIENEATTRHSSGPQLMSLRLSTARGPSASRAPERDRTSRTRVAAVASKLVSSATAPSRGATVNTPSPPARSQIAAPLAAAGSRASSTARGATGIERVASSTSPRCSTAGAISTSIACRPAASGGVQSPVPSSSIRHAPAVPSTRHDPATNRAPPAD
jgi:hypothetical protein